MVLLVFFGCIVNERQQIAEPHGFTPSRYRECYLTVCEINCQSKQLKYTYCSEKSKTLRHLLWDFCKTALTKHETEHSDSLINFNETYITKKKDQNYTGEPVQIQT